MAKSHETTSRKPPGLRLFKDVAFLAVYSLGMFFAGHLGDRMDLRIVLTIGMIGTAIFTALFGAGYWLNIHNFYYFLVFQMIAGLFQSSGWPSVVAVVGNWFGKSKRGLIMGIWNAHTSIGNISGSLLAASLLKFGWGWSFAIPSIIMALAGLVVFFFLPVSPDVMEIDIDDGEINSDKDTAKEPLLEPGQEVKHEAIGFLEAWRIPGVAPFALCLFFSKLVAYTFLYWLPFYISHTPIGNEYLSDAMAGSLSTVFDVGADLGTHSSLNGNSRALATVTAIIDGTGSVGAAIGPLLTGYISTESWSAVFTMLMAAALLAGLLLTHLVCAELRGKLSSNVSRVVANAQTTCSDLVSKQRRAAGGAVLYCRYAWTAIKLVESPISAAGTHQYPSMLMNSDE
ncbi:hypothetical protein ZWY2020_003750 [Hordeum vulgare]|nr:hypothetical protein ZWY2020_003750 [Hordeum vulgare]